MGKLMNWILINLGYLGFLATSYQLYKYHIITPNTVIWIPGIIAWLIGTILYFKTEGGKIKNE